MRTELLAISGSLCFLVVRKNVALTETKNGKLSFLCFRWRLGSEMWLTANPLRDLCPVTGLEVIEESGADGIVRFTRLPYGTYYVKEVYVPADFRISEVITTVVIPVDPGFELIITNYRRGEDLPVTGTTGALIFLGAGVVLIGAGIFFGKRKKKDKI